MHCVWQMRESIHFAQTTRCTVHGVRRVVALNPSLPPAPTSAGAFASCRVALDTSLELFSSAVSQVRSPYEVPRHAPALPISAQLAVLLGCATLAGPHAELRRPRCQPGAGCRLQHRPAFRPHRLFHAATTGKMCIPDMYTRLVSMLHNNKVQSLVYGIPAHICIDTHGSHDLQMLRL